MLLAANIDPCCTTLRYMFELFYVLILLTETVPVVQLRVSDVTETRYLSCLSVLGFLIAKIQNFLYIIQKNAIILRLAQKILAALTNGEG